MRTRSLGVRLILLSCLSIIVALIVTGFVLSDLFRGYFKERLYQELERQLTQLTANIALDADDNIVVSDLPDPRFAMPFSGLYWQIRETDGEDIFSRSLWGEPLEIIGIPEAGQAYRGEINATEDTVLLTLSWRILLGDEASPRELVLTVAVDEAEISPAIAEFRQTLVRWLALMFAFLMIASWVQVRLGLSPLEAIRGKIQGIRSGSENRLAGTFPTEVVPLANEVNELLSLHETSLDTARARASDLAHGLKTPLTIMLTFAKDLEDEGRTEMADDIRSQVASMHHYVERELARTRLQVPAGIHTVAKPVVEKMVQMMAKLPKETPIDWQVDIPEDLETPFDRHDLSELLGNILDNARKWTRSTVRISGTVLADGRQQISVEDDGPGVPDELVETILKRGGRLDENIQGTGLGLAICADMADAYNAELKLERSALGGLNISFVW